MADSGSRATSASEPGPPSLSPYHPSYQTEAEARAGAEAMSAAVTRAQAAFKVATRKDTSPQPEASIALDRNSSRGVASRVLNAGGADLEAGARAEAVAEAAARAQAAAGLATRAAA